jgi:Fur family zinc uptake transcriptional regulator
MGSVQDVIASAERQCAERGVRLTPKRKLVLEGLVKSESALSAYELADYCSRTYGKSMAPMSVYRILEFLQEEHFAHKLNVANKYIACSHIACDHEHQVPQFLICNRCHKVKEVGIPKATITALKRTVNSAGYSLLSPQLELNCLCDKCARDTE